MPIYEYECSKCGHQSEVWQKFSDEPLTECTICNGKMKKLISHSTFHLKGSGWYVTDYASKGNTNAGKKETSSKDNETTTKETKSSDDKTKNTTSSKKKEKKAKE